MYAYLGGSTMLTLLAIGIVASTGMIAVGLMVSENSRRYLCRNCDRSVLLRDATDEGPCVYRCCRFYRCPHCGEVTIRPRERKTC